MENFLLNFGYLLEIDITPEDTTSTYAVVGSGISSLTPALNESLDQTKYLSGEGFGTTDVIGAQYTIDVSGHRDYNDTAQNYIFNNMLKLGPKRKTTARLTYPDGAQVVKGCTIANISPASGDAAAKGSISFSIHMNGKPSYTVPQVAPALADSFDVGTAVGSTSFSATPAAGNKLGYEIFGTTIPTAENLNVKPENLDSYDYTSGADILNLGQAIVADTYIIAYELTANDRVVKAIVHKVLTAEIKA